jgi:hypothetical protein
MILRKLTDGGPWEVAAVADEHGVCALVSELERMRSDPATTEVANAFRSQFRLVVREGPSVFTDRVFEFVDEPIFAFKRSRFRAIGFCADKRLVICCIIEVIGRSGVPADAIASAKAIYMQYQDHDQRIRREPFHLN